MIDKDKTVEKVGERGVSKHLGTLNHQWVKGLGKRKSEAFEQGVIVSIGTFYSQE